MKKSAAVLFAVLLAANAWCQTEILVQRANSSINSGFKERIYIDGKEVLTLTNGETGRIMVSNGNHTIHAALSSLMTTKWPFSAEGETIAFVVNPQSARSLAIEPASGVSIAAPAVQAPVPAAQRAVEALKAVTAPRAPAAPTPKPQGTGVVGSLQSAADKVMEKIPAAIKIAIVNVSSKDPDIAEFIANELEYIMVEEGLTLIDRSQLDTIRKEQNLQMSGEVDDKQAVSIGKIAGAGVIITGAVTGTGELRRLRLRALDTQSAQVLSVASEAF
ncbi:hypothetical protein FACS189485_00690 [Spirochaetia bacterium]|nr:hypothetical protein FACS189485_00690 [Spirochaetia bacterium]